MKALINPSNNLVLEVVETSFEVASPLFWVDCESTIVANQYVYINGQFSVYVPTPPTAEENKKRASELLYETDWTTIPDIADPALSNPYLTNQAEFITWRSQVRAIAVNPVEGENLFSPKPQAQWSS
jgi:hypothetical protein